jgi:uncharacterized delta-60 repeat protein
MRASGPGQRSRLLLVVAGFAVAAGALTTAFGGGGHAGAARAGFGIGGKVRTDFGGDEVANALALQRDGKIVAAGVKGSDFALARYTRDGRLDESFGTGGKVVTHLGARPLGWSRGVPGGAAAVAVQGGGKILVAGGAGRDFVLARYTPAGRLDRSFGSSGKVVTDVGGRRHRNVREVLGAKAIALQADGRIILAGTGRRHFALARYTRNGRLDASFGRRGVVVTRVGREDAAEAVAVQADGRIVAAGWSDFTFAVVRYLRNGQLDRSFGTGGKAVTLALGDDFDIAKAVAVQRDGKIVAAGSTGPRFPAGVLVRYTRTGRPDRSFGIRGQAISGRCCAGDATAVAIRRDRKILLAEDWNYLTDPCCSGQIAHNAALLRFTTRGRPDRTFGDRGVALTPIDRGEGSTDNLVVSALGLRRDGRIVVAGGYGSTAKGESFAKRDFFLVGYRSNGRLDS